MILKVLWRRRMVLRIGRVEELPRLPPLILPHLLLQSRCSPDHDTHSLKPFYDLLLLVCGGQAWTQQLSVPPSAASSPVILCSRPTTYSSFICLFSGYRPGPGTVLRAWEASVNKEAPALVETNSHTHNKQVSYMACYKVKRRCRRTGSGVPGSWR